MKLANFYYTKNQGCVRVQNVQDQGQGHD